MNDSTKRFSSRVENYVKYRPGYPPAVIGLLQRECGLTAGSVVADIGSGTGILTGMFLENGNQVFAVEPNAEMRGAGEKLLGGSPQFHSVAGTAEATTLRDGSIDLIVAGQVFHWFDREKTRREFVRILKPDGWVVLIWNDRKTDSTPFLAAYEAFLVKYATDYAVINHKQIDAGVIGAFFQPGGFQLARFPNQQVFDFTGLKGRLLSSSYAPERGDPRHEPMLRELEELFEKHRHEERVAFDYDTSVYYGRLISG